MKTANRTRREDIAAIVRLTGTDEPPGTSASPGPQRAAAAASTDGHEAGADALARAKAFAEPLLTGRPLDTGEDALAHAEGVAAILNDIGATPQMRAAAYLVYAADHLQRPEEVVAKAFGPSYAGLVLHTRQLVRIQRAARAAVVDAQNQAMQVERVRKMLLAFSHDLRVVLLRLASRLQTLRWHAQSRVPCPAALARESLEVFAPLANRLGIWQIKWEMEDLAFRFLHPDEYHRIAGLLDQTRTAREAGVARASREVATMLADLGLAAEVEGRPKHIYSIWKKMRGKGLAFDRVFDISALRVVVADVPACYTALARIHEHFRPLTSEFDDYIARPKANGYQSLHTVVLGDDGRAIEVQIRTRTMHQHAETGVAAHWAYKEAGTKGYAGVVAAGDFENRIAEARRAVLRQLLAWERDFAGQAAPTGAAGSGDPQAPSFADRIYVLTPQAAVIELPAGASAIDFAYALHSDLGHRCRGARVDGVLVPLNTALANGQTVEITTTKEGGPSLDWLNPELGYLKSPRARAKVRAWFNAQAVAQTVARGREAVERVLQREGRTALKLDDLAAQLGFRSADELFEVVGKDEYSLRHIENLLRPAPAAAPEAEPVALKRARTTEGGVLVVGVESLMTHLARCCRPAPPDEIGGYVTRGQGVAIHRSACSNFQQMARTTPDRVIAVAWGERSDAATAAYPVDVQIEATDRQGLLRDISEIFAREKMNVIAVNTRSVRDTDGDTAQMTFTIEVADATRLNPALRQINAVSGVRGARRRR